jgi:YD repeat-containing protein
MRPEFDADGLLDPIPVYDAKNKLIGVMQDAQSSITQSRTFTYDDLGRITSETNPESGAVAYTYAAHHPKLVP